MGRSKTIWWVLAILLLIIQWANAQPYPNRYIVFFSDKTGTPYSVTQPEEFLSLKSIARRTKQNIALTVQDLPVNPNYVNAIKATGAKVLFSTRWMNGVVVEAFDEQKADIENMNIVSGVEYVALRENGYIPGRQRSNLKFETAQTTQVSDNQNSMLALDEMHAEGITGEGITIAVLDTGFPGVNTNPAFSLIVSGGRILDSYNFANLNPNVFTGHPHGAQVFSIIAASSSTFEGGAYQANFLLYATEFVQTEFRIEEYNWLAAVERADSAGADIITSSLGYTDFDEPSMNYAPADLDGNTAVITRAANIAFQKGMLVIVSAGNYGNDTWHFISPPADGESILAIGSVGTDLSHAPFSSYGPTADGRIKPDVMALGNPAATIMPNGSIKYETGTSVSCPLVASLAAGIMQAWPGLTAAQVVHLIRQSGSYAFHPDNTYGYGVPTYRSVKNFIDPPATAGSNFSVYPNPSDMELNIVQASPDGSPTRVLINSLMGQRMYDVQYESIWHLNPFRLDISSLVPGIYIVTVENKSNRKSFRIIKR